MSKVLILIMSMLYINVTYAEGPKIIIHEDVSLPTVEVLKTSPPVKDDVAAGIIFKPSKISTPISLSPMSGRTMSVVIDEPPVKPEKEKTSATIIKSDKNTVKSASVKSVKSKDSATSAKVEVVKETPVAAKVEVVKETPVAAKVEVAKETPVAVKSEVAKETPVDVKSEVAKETPVAAKVEVAKETPVAAKVEVAKETPVAAKVEVAKETPVAAKVEVAKETPVAAKVEVAKETPVESKVLADTSMITGNNNSDNLESENSNISDGNSAYMDTMHIPVFIYNISYTASLYWSELSSILDDTVLKINNFQYIHISIYLFIAVLLGLILLLVFKVRVKLFGSRDPVYSDQWFRPLK